MTTRYTYNRLKEDISKLNQKLEGQNHGYRLVIGGRNGYTAVDLARTQEHKRGTCVRTIECGTPMECLKACEDYISGLTNYLKAYEDYISGSTN